MMRDIFNKMAVGVDLAERKIIRFTVGTVECGVDIMKVREILNPGIVTPLPGAAPWILGAADYRSTLVPVVDMRVRLHQPKREMQKEKWVVVSAIDRGIALLVDRVHEVVTVTSADERDRNPLDEQASANWISRVYGHDGGLLFELDIAAIATEADERSVAPWTGRQDARQE
jgi:purine-binding chemotaxis protein CheW